MSALAPQPEPPSSGPASSPHAPPSPSAQSDASRPADAPLVRHSTAPLPFKARVLQFFRSSAVGIVATAADMAVLEVCMRVVGMSRVWSKVISLAVGTSIQFFGSRHFAFRAQRGRIERQLKLFVFVEVLAYGVTVFVFKVFADWLHVQVEFANLLSGSVVYFGFSYPLWRRVFRVTPQERQVGERSA